MLGAHKPGPVADCPECKLMQAEMAGKKSTSKAIYLGGEPVPPFLKSIYIIGSLRNKNIPTFANELQAQGFEAFADWYQPGPDADDHWRDYSRARGRTYKEALKSHGADQIFDFDKHHLDRCDAAVMLMPAGKSGHLELGYTIGRGKPGFILFDEEPERFEVMVKFATDVFFNKEDLFQALKSFKNNRRKNYGRSRHTNTNN